MRLSRNTCMELYTLNVCCVGRQSNYMDTEIIGYIVIIPTIHNHTTRFNKDKLDTELVLKFVVEYYLNTGLHSMFQLDNVLRRSDTNYDSLYIVE